MDNAVEILISSLGWGWLLDINIHYSNLLVQTEGYWNLSRSRVFMTIMSAVLDSALSYYSKKFSLNKKYVQNVEDSRT